jgi:hypothetical protein
MEIRRNIVTHERKEARNGVGSVGITNKLVEYGMVVEDIGKKRGPGVNGDYGEDADDVFLFVRPEVMQSVHHYVPDRYRDGNRGQQVADDEGEEVERDLLVAKRQGDFKDEFVRGLSALTVAAHDEVGGGSLVERSKDLMENSKGVDRLYCIRHAAVATDNIVCSCPLEGI